MNNNCSSIINLPLHFPVFTLLAVLFASAPLASQYAWAQEDPCRNVITAARQDYQRGLFDEASFRLSTCISRRALTAEQEKEAYLLLGQIYYANLEEEKARDSVRHVLERDPSIQLNPEEHKSGFIDLVSEVMQEIQLDLEAPPVRRSGFWLSVGGGPAEGSIRCDCPLVNAVIADDDPWKGGAAGSFSLAMGGTVNPKLQLGAELNQWSRAVDENDRTSNIAFLSFIAKYYPSETGNFFLKGGFGFGGATLENNVVKLQAGGAGLHFGLGYDILLGREKKMALTPFMNLNVLYADEDVAVVQNVRLRGPSDPSYFQLGLAFTLL